MKILRSDHEINHPHINDVLIYDLETDGLDTNTAKIKFFGAYSYKNKKYYFVHGDDPQAIKKLLDEHRVHVGFNNQDFDKPILQNNGYYDEVTYKTEIDLLRVLYDYDRKRPNREPLIKLKDGRSLAAALPNRKLKTIGEVLGLSVEKGDIDYRIFRKNNWTPEELKKIYYYLYKDLVLTREFFEYLLDYFDGFRSMVPEENVMKFQYLKSSGGSFAYSAICHLAGLAVEWEDDEEKKEERPENHGGFVLEPQTDYAQGTIVYADWSSLYPHIMFMGNLFTRDPQGWDGSPLAQLQGRYGTKTRGRIEETLKKIYDERRRLKEEKNPHELGYKITMNAVYGISGSPVFKNLYNQHTPGDITILGRAIMHKTKEMFEAEGMKVIYGDTDSAFIHLEKEQSMQDFERVAQKVTEHIKGCFPFPEDSFKLDVDDVFTHLWLYKKKHYAGLNHKNRFVIKGLPIIKHDASRLGKEIFSRIEHLIVARKNMKFPRKLIMKLIDDLIRQDVTWVSRDYNVKSIDKYANDSSIQAQISREYGEGLHRLVPNKKLGRVGKAIKYCTVDEATVLSVDDIVLTKTLKELEPFMEDE